MGFSIILISMVDNFYAGYDQVSYVLTSLTHGQSAPRTCACLISYASVYLLTNHDEETNASENIAFYLILTVQRLKSLDRFNW